MNKVYLGDGVYIDSDGYHLILTTENGIEVTNTIYLNDHVTIALYKHLVRTFPKLKGLSKHD